MILKTEKIKTSPGPAACRALLTAAATALAAVAAFAQPAVQQTSASAPTAAAEPRYAAKDIARAFSFIDANKDAKISRDEAAGFRGVAKYFDRADTNKDQALSQAEFGYALNYEKKP